MNTFFSGEELRIFQFSGTGNTECCCAVPFCLEAFYYVQIKKLDIGEMR